MLAAGVAHALNNPANYTRLSVAGLSRELEQLRTFLRAEADADADHAVLAELERRLDAMHATLKRIDDGTRRMAGLVEDLRRFSDEGDGKTFLAAPDHGLAATLALVGAQYDGQVHIDYRASNPDAVGDCCPAALNQVFMSLAHHACQVISARINGQAAGQGCLRVSSRLRQRAGQSWWQVCFDSGPGMEPDPSFTGKAGDDSVSLTLAASSGIVRQHGGCIEVESGPGAGSRFLLSLPLRAKGATITELEYGAV